MKRIRQAVEAVAEGEYEHHRALQVAEITDTEYFRNLQNKAPQMRTQRQNR